VELKAAYDDLAVSVSERLAVQRERAEQRASDEAARSHGALAAETEEQGRLQQYSGFLKVPAYPPTYLPTSLPTSLPALQPTNLPTLPPIVLL
jgi:hypothetical protein